MNAKWRVEEAYCGLFGFTEARLRAAELSGRVRPRFMRRARHRIAWLVEVPA